MFKRLEWRTAVVRFGSRHSQRVLKDLDAPLTPALGQLMLEAFTWSEGTYPATACAVAGEHVFK